MVTVVLLRHSPDIRNFDSNDTALQTINCIRYYAIQPTESILILTTRNRYLREAALASGCVELPFPSSAASVCLPWCTPAANLPGSQTSWIPPVLQSIKAAEIKKLKSTTQSLSQLRKEWYTLVNLITVPLDSMIDNDPVMMRAIGFLVARYLHSFIYYAKNRQCILCSALTLHAHVWCKLTKNAGPITCEYVLSLSKLSIITMVTNLGFGIWELISVETIYDLGVLHRNIWESRINLYCNNS